MMRYIITTAFLACLSTSIYAEDIPLNPNHPVKHVVKKGDTLWDISGKFLKNPWQWPKVWRMNKAQIKNPHRIYPGDVVVLDMSGKTPQLRLLHETVTLQPHAVEEPMERGAISAIPLNVIAQFLNQPLVIEPNQLENSPRIIASLDERVTFDAGTRVYINNIDEGDHLDWYIYRPGENLIDPETKEVLGVQANYLGNLKVTKYGAPASADITKSREEIFAKDRLVPISGVNLTTFTPHAPEEDIKGRIVSVYGGVAEAGVKSIITINRGNSHGVEVGHVFAIKRYGRIIKDPEAKPTPANSKPKLKELNFDVSTGPDGKKIVNFEKEKPLDASAAPLEPGMVKLPDERVGLVMIFRTFDRISYGLVMQSDRAINIEDVIQTP